MTFLQNSTINRKSFRHRKVDNKKPLRIYTPGEINEDDCIPVSRAGIEIETGVEKEEEEEWHLVHALKVRTESMEKGATASGKATIPVPTSSRRISYYADVYQTHKWKKPSTYVKFSLPVEECIGCLYCMDEKDDIWLAEHKQKNHSTLTEDQFEEIMQHFENVAKNKPQLLAKKQIPTWQDCDAFLPESLNGLRSEAETVHAHWRAKRWERMKQYQKAGPLMFEIKTQEGKDEEDHPWTCFRRRELKPIRRTRRTETASFDKLRKIRKDIHSGRHIMVNVTVREKTKKQKIELDRKIFEKECSVRELRKKLGIRNETSHEQPKRRKSSFAMDLLGATKTKSGIKLSKKDDEYPMTDITDFPYLIQRKPAAASFFRKFDSLKPTDRNSISCTAFRSRFGRGGRRRRVIDRLDVFSYKRIRETNERYKYDSDGIEDVFSDDEINQLDDDDDDQVEDFTENMIRFHLFKEEDYQNLGVYRRIQKEKQNSPTKQHSLDALTGNHIPAQNPQHTPLANTESRQNIEQRDSRFARSNNTESRTTSQLDTRANQDSRQKLDLDPRTSTDPRRTNISNVDPRTFIDPRAFNGVNRSQNTNTESSTNRDPRLSSNPPSTPRISNDPRTPRLVVNNLNISDPRAHNGLILRPTVAVNHRENTTPYRRPMPRNARLAEDSNNNTIGGVTNVVATPNGIASSLISAGSNNTSMPAASSLAKNHATTSAAQINSPARTSSSNGNTNGQGNGDGLTRTSSNQGIITNGTGQMVDPSKVFMTSSGHAKILMNGSGQMIDPSKIMVNSTGIINSNQIEAQKISNMVKQQQQALNTSIQSTGSATQQMITPEQFSQITQLTDPESQRIMQQILSLYKTSNSVSTSNVAQLNNQRQPVAQTPRQNITVPSVGSNVPNSAISLLPTGMVQSPSTSVMRQNNAVQSSGSSSSAKPVIAQNFALPNGFNISPTSGSSNVRQNVVQSNIQKLRHINQNVSIGVNGSQNIMNTNVSNNGLQTINVNPNVSIGVNGSQQPFVHPSGIVNINNMGGIIQTNGQSPMRTANINGRSYLLPGNIQLNGNLRPNVLTGNGSAHLANMVLPVNTAAINNVAQASNLANLNRHQLVNGAATPNLRQVSTNGAAIPNLRQLPNGAYINTNVFANNGNFGNNLTQMRPQTMMRIPNTLLGGNQILANGTSMYDLILPSQSPRQNNVSPASVSTSNGGNNSVGTPSPQPQAEQRTVR